MRPRVDHLIVALTVRDVAGVVRALETLDALLGLLEQRLLLGRNLEILDSDRHAALRRVPESELLEPVEELHRARQTLLTVRLEHELAEHLLLHLAVLVAERGRHDGVEHHASDRRVLPPLAVHVVHQVPHRRVERRTC